MASATERPSAALAAEPSVAELVRQLSEQTSRLAREEVELAKAELTAPARPPLIRPSRPRREQGRCCERTRCPPRSSVRSRSAS